MQPTFKGAMFLMKYVDAEPASFEKVEG